MMNAPNLALTLLLLGGSAFKLTGCDLKVRLFDYFLKPTNALVTIASDEGLEIAQERSKNGVAEFCDLGIAEFNVHVGIDGCGQVQVRRLTVYQGHTREIPVFYRNCHAHIPRTHCQYLLRLQDNSGSTIAEATVSIGKFTYISDKFGRVRLSINLHKPAEIVITAPRFKEYRMTLACSAPYDDFERVIVLEKLR